MISMISAICAIAHAKHDEAKRHYEAAVGHFNLREFKEASAEFEAAYRIKPEPSLLYNLAQSYRLAGDRDKALYFYERFLRTGADETNRAEVEARIRELKPAPAPQVVAPIEPVQVTKTPPVSERKPLYKKWWIWTIAGGATAALVIGLSVGLTVHPSHFNANLGTFGPSLGVRF